MKEIKLNKQITVVELLKILAQATVELIISLVKWFWKFKFGLLSFLAVNGLYIMLWWPGFIHLHIIVKILISWWGIPTTIFVAWFLCRRLSKK